MDAILISKKSNDLYNYLLYRWNSCILLNSEDGRLILEIGKSYIIIDCIDSFIPYEEYISFFQSPSDYNYFSLKAHAIEVFKLFLIESNIPFKTWIDNDQGWIDTVDVLKNNMDFYKSLS